MLTKLDRLKGYSARETCVALLSMLAILLFASAIAVAQTPIVVSQQFWGANETNSTATFGNTTVATVGGNWAHEPTWHRRADAEDRRPYDRARCGRQDYHDRQPDVAAGPAVSFRVCHDEGRTGPTDQGAGRRVGPL